MSQRNLRLSALRVPIICLSLTFGASSGLAEINDRGASSVRTIYQINPSAYGQRTEAGDMMIDDAAILVQTLYDRYARAVQGDGDDPLFSDTANQYFTSDIVALFQSGQIDGHPLYGAQDFDGRIVSIAPDPEQPMLRGMITVNVDFINFGQKKRAIYYLRSDDTQDNAPLLIFSVDHDGWSYP